MRRDRAIHQRLRDRGRVLLLMPVLAEANQIDHHAAPELRAIVEREAHGHRHGFRIVAVDVQNRRLDHLGDVGA